MPTGVLPFHKRISQWSLIFSEYQLIIIILPVEAVKRLFGNDRMARSITGEQ
jgi:hypothetical protein